MFVSETQIRVHYALTDQMGIVYHGHYAQFHEIGRTEAIRTLGYSYKDIEKMGIIMPVVDIHTRFLLPAKYDDVLTVRTTLKELPANYRIVFHGDIFVDDRLINTSVVTLFFMEAAEMKRTNIPAVLRESLLGYFPGSSEKSEQNIQ